MTSGFFATAFVSLGLGCLIKLFCTYWIRKASANRNVYDSLLISWMAQSLSTPYGCFSPPRLPNQRPFGFDRLDQLVRADAECRLMQTITFYFRQTAHTLEHVFLGKSIYGTIEPTNIEALFTQDKGQSSISKFMDIISILNMQKNLA
jgi:hypothetical protein